MMMCNKGYMWEIIRHVYSRCAPVAVFIRYSLNASSSRDRDVAAHETDVESHHRHLLKEQ